MYDTGIGYYPPIHTAHHKWTDSIARVCTAFYAPSGGDDNDDDDDSRPLD